MKPLRVSFFKNLKRLRDQDVGTAVKHQQQQQKQQQQPDVKNGEVELRPVRPGPRPDNEERPRQKSPNNQKDRANFVDIEGIKFKVFK